VDIKINQCASTKLPSIHQVTSYENCAAKSRTAYTK